MIPVFLLPLETGHSSLQGYEYANAKSHSLRILFDQPFSTNGSEGAGFSVVRVLGECHSRLFFEKLVPAGGWNKRKGLAATILEKADTVHGSRMKFI